MERSLTSEDELSFPSGQVESVLLQPGAMGLGWDVEWENIADATGCPLGPSTAHLSYEQTTRLVCGAAGSVPYIGGSRGDGGEDGACAPRGEAVLPAW